MTEHINASRYLLDRHVAAGNDGRLAVTGARGDFTYAELYDQVVRMAGALRAFDLQPEQRLLMFMADSPEFIVLYLAAMRIGAIPVPVPTTSHADQLGELLSDSRAKLLAVSDDFAAVSQAAIASAPGVVGVIGPDCVPGRSATTDAYITWTSFSELLASAPDAAIYPTTSDSPAFWPYTSGTTGTPKAAMHRHGSISVVCDTYGSQVLRIQPGDRCLSAAKAFFSYGLGNSVLFPLSVGTVSVLDPTPSKPNALAALIQKHDVTLFFAGPTFFTNSCVPNYRRMPSPGSDSQHPPARHCPRPGRDLVSGLVEQVARFAPTYVLGQQAQVLEQTDTGTIKITTDKGVLIRAKAVVISGGIGTFTPRPLPAGSEFLGRGLSFFVPALDAYADQNVVVVGGGDTACDWALSLEPTARSFTLVQPPCRIPGPRSHRRSTARLHSLGRHRLRGHQDPRIRQRRTGRDHRQGRVYNDAARTRGHRGTRVHGQPPPHPGLGSRDRRQPVHAGRHDDGHERSRRLCHRRHHRIPGQVCLISVGFGEAATAVNKAAVLIHPDEQLFPGHSSDSEPAAV